MAEMKALEEQDDDGCTINHEAVRCEEGAGVGTCQQRTKGGRKGREKILRLSKK